MSTTTRKTTQSQEALYIIQDNSEQIQEKLLQTELQTGEKLIIKNYPNTVIFLLINTLFGLFFIFKALNCLV